MGANGRGRATGTICRSDGARGGQESAKKYVEVKISGRNRKQI